MTYATDPQLQPADSGPMLSPGDYHWVEKRGDTTGRSLIYALGATLMVLSLSFTLSGTGHYWTTFTLAAGFILVIGVGLTSKRRKVRARLPLTYYLVTLAIFIGCFFFLFYYDQTNLESLYWRLPAVMALTFIYARFVGPGYVKVPEQPQNRQAARP